MHIFYEYIWKMVYLFHIKMLHNIYIAYKIYSWQNKMWAITQCLS